MSFRPDIKPPQWGPLSAVQYAVRANAERLGVGDLRAISPCQDGLLDNILASPGTGLLRGSGAKPVGYYQEFAKTAENVNNSCYTNSAANLNSRQLTFFGVFRQRSLPAAYTASPLQVGMHTWAGGNNNFFRVRIAANGTAEISAEGNSSRKIGAAATIALGNWYAVAATVNADSHLSFRFALKNLDSGGVVLNRSNIYNASIPTFSPVGYGLGCCFEYERNYDTDTDVAFFGASASLVSESTVLTLVEQPYALLMPVSRPVYFDLGGGGGGGFTETLDSLIASIASATDQQAYQAVVDTLITAGATIQSVADMLEALLSLGQSTSQATAAQDYTDQAQTTATEQASAAAAQNYADAAQTTAQESATTGSAQDYTDAATTVVVEQSGVTEQLIGAGAVETLLTVATSAAQASAAQAFVETLTTIAQSASSLSQVATLTEAIGSTIASITTANDRQLFVENLAIVAISSSSLAEIGAYIEQVASAASSQATLTDVLVGQFVGRYLMVDYARPRNFIDLARPRIFIDYARPRSFIDYARPRSRRLQ